MANLLRDWNSGEGFPAFRKFCSYARINNGYLVQYEAAKKKRIRVPGGRGPIGGAKVDEELWTTEFVTFFCKDTKEMQAKIAEAVKAQEWIVKLEDDGNMEFGAMMGSGGSA